MLIQSSHSSHCFIDTKTSMLPQKRSINSSSTLPSQHQDGSSSPSFSLENVVRQYAAQPELLELILSSKVEEDRRRAEEAKLKQKEIDYILQQQQQDEYGKRNTSGNAVSQYERSSRSNSYQYQSKQYLPPISPPPPPSSSSPSSSSLPSTLQPSVSSSSSSSSEWASQQQRSSQSIEWRSTAIILPPLTSSSPSSSSSSSSALSPSLSSASFSPNLGSEPSRLDTAFNNKQALPPSPKRNYSLSEASSSDMNHKRMTMDHHRHRRQTHSTVISHPPPAQAPLSPPIENVSPKLTAPKPPSTSSSITATGLKRRRREMQAITTIIETREFPYNDDYLWRNNGNTIHRKTGNKSIYYKCANSQQGCPVNKTCTLRQDTGEYLIKYRGTHLPDCSTIKRINDV